MTTTLRGSDSFDTAQASQLEMELGTETASRVMSPEGVAQAVAALENAPVTNTLSVGNLFHIQDQKPSNTDGGTFTANVWQTRDLTTVLTNTIVGASLSSNQVTLPAGTYYIEAWGDAVKVNRNQTRIYNISDSVVLLTGSNGYAPTANASPSGSRISGTFTLASGKVIELRHRCQTTAITDGLGIDVGSQFTTDYELYAELKIWKVG